MIKIDEITYEMIADVLNKKDYKMLREYFEEYNIVDLAEVINEAPIDWIVVMMKVLKKKSSADLFTYLDADVQEKLIQTLTSPQIRELLDNLMDDDMVDFIEEMPSNVAKIVLSAASAQTRQDINFLLSFKENTAGSILTTEYVELNETDTVMDAIDKIKAQGKVAETINHCYVVSSKRRLIGEIALKEILFEDSDAKIADLIDEDVVYVKTDDDQEEVARIIQKYDITVVPVVNDDHCLVGIITVDDILDVMEEEVTEDIHKMNAVAPIEGSYMESSVLEIVKSRLPWLLILMISATFTGGIIAGFEDALAVSPILTSFIPMLMGSGGNAGSQASTMVIRGISVDGLGMKDFFKVFFKELQVACFCGAVLLIVNTLRILIFTQAGLQVALIVSITLFFTIIVSKIVGGLLPLLTLLIKQDPAAVASPVITTISDALTLVIYFNLAITLLH